MPRIKTLATIDQAPEASRPILEAVNDTFGSVPNMFRLLGVSSATLEGYMGLTGALAKGQLNESLRERIALAVSQVNSAGYCLAAHTYLGKRVANLNDVEILANRTGKSTDTKANAAVQFAVKVALNRGNVSVLDVRAVKNEGYSDGEVLEIIAQVALSTLTNYINEALKTEIDFPIAPALPA